MPHRRLRHRAAWIAASIVSAGCTEGEPPIVGSWTLATWSITVGDPAAPILDETRDDAGFLEFEGDGTWFESEVVLEVPRYVDRPEPAVVPMHGWSFWTWQDALWTSGRTEPELWIAWYHAYGGQTGIFVVEDRDRDQITAVADYELGSSSVGLTPVVERWVLVREAP